MAFRKIDIDQYDEERFGEEELLEEYDSGRDPGEVESAVQSRSVDVRNLLQRYAHLTAAALEEIRI